MENLIEVGSQFNEVAQDYDKQRRMLIPCFDDFYGTAVSVADMGMADTGLGSEPHSDVLTPRILDLGAGTGLLSAFMLNKYPDAHLTLIDISDKMLDIAKTRLKHVPGVRYMLEDYTHYAAAADEKFDIIVSGLSIHHLTDEDKFSLYRNTYANLKPNGVFVNADQVLGHTAAVDSLYKSDWRRKVEANGLSREELEAAYERTKLDKMTGLQTQLGWLQEIGFSDVDCVYKYFNFVVMVGRKNGIEA